LNWRNSRGHAGSGAEQQPAARRLKNWPRLASIGAVMSQVDSISRPLCLTKNTDQAHRTPTHQPAGVAIGSSYGPMQMANHPLMHKLV
jgi:hypothetical protein